MLIDQRTYGSTKIFMLYRTIHRMNRKSDGRSTPNIASTIKQDNVHFMNIEHSYCYLQLIRCEQEKLGQTETFLLLKLVSKTL